MDPRVVYPWQRRFKAHGRFGVSTRPRERTSISTRVSVQVMMDVFQRRDTTPLLGRYRVKMALDALGYRDGHTTVWQLVALYTQAHPTPASPPRTSKTAERPLPTPAPHQGWCIDVRYLTKIDGPWIDSILLFDGDSRAIVGAGCVDRQHPSRVAQVCRQAIAHRGAPETVVRDNAGGLLALSPCLQPLGIRWAPITKGHPWQNRAAGGFAMQRRLLEACVVGGTARELVYRQQAPFVQADQCWGHGAHTRTEARGRLDHPSPEVIPGHARGRTVEPTRLRRAFRLRQLPRQVRRRGQMRLHHCGLYGDHGLAGQTVEGSIDDETMRSERAEHLLVAYPGVHAPRQRRLTAVDGTGRQHYRQAQVLPLLFRALELARTVRRRPR